MIKLSIIVPVFNGEKYIVEALDSYFQQADSAIQVVVVDDGSTDGTNYLISSKYQAYIDSGSLILVRQENGGVSNARNNALRYALGEYITFFDGDDILLEGYVCNVLNAIDNNRPDVVEFGFKTFVNSKCLELEVDQYVHQRFGLNDFDNVKEEVFAKSIWYPCIRAFKRSLFEGRYFPEGIRFCEDMMLLTKVYQDVKTVFQIEKSLYGYRINVEGATFNIRPDYLANLIKFYNSLPTDKARYLDYLKINLSYVMYRCYDGSELPVNIRHDFFMLFIQYVFDKKLSFRKKIILGFPNTHRRLKGVLKK